MQQLEVLHTHPMLWTSGVYPDVCQEIILNQLVGNWVAGVLWLFIHTQLRARVSSRVCVPVKGLLEQAICILWLQGTSNWKGWDHAGSKYFGKNKKLNRFLDVWEGYSQVLLCPASGVPVTPHVWSGTWTRPPSQLPGWAVQLAAKPNALQLVQNTHPVTACP